MSHMSVSEMCWELLDLGSETELRAQKEALGREEAKASHGLRHHMVSLPDRRCWIFFSCMRKQDKGPQLVIIFELFSLVVVLLLVVVFYAELAVDVIIGSLLWYPRSWLVLFHWGVFTTLYVSSSPMSSVYCGIRDGKFSILRCTARFEALPT